jgi:hypothetical protein
VHLMCARHPSSHVRAFGVSGLRHSRVSMHVHPASNLLCLISVALDVHGVSASIRTHAPSWQLSRLITVLARGVSALRSACVAQNIVALNAGSGRI